MIGGTKTPRGGATPRLGASAQFSSEGTQMKIGSAEHPFARPLQAKTRELRSETEERPFRTAPRAA